MSDTQKILKEVEAERERQNGKWGGPTEDDRRKQPEHWCDDLLSYIHWAKMMARMGSPEKYRRRMMQIAALATAACESFDRLAKPQPEAQLFCDECCYLTPTEEEQHRSGNNEQHRCTWLHLNLVHGRHHPRIPRPEQCTGGPYRRGILQSHQSPKAPAIIAPTRTEISVKYGSPEQVQLENAGRNKDVILLLRLEAEGGLSRVRVITGTLRASESLVTYTLKEVE